MPAGFQIFGDNGNLQVDENYFNMSCVQKGTVYLPAGDAYDRTLSRVSLTFDGVYPMLFLRPRNSVAAVTSIVVDGASHKFTIVGGLAEGGAPKEDWVDWYLFDRPPPPAPHGAGLQVFNGNSECVFDSDYPPMRVIGLFPIPMTFDDPVYELPWGHYAACIGQGRQARVSVSDTTGSTWVDTFIIKDTQLFVKMSRLLIGGPSNGSSWATGGGGNVLLIDSSRL